METAHDYGFAYAQDLHNHGEELSFVDFEQSCPEIPSEDYVDMNTNGIEVDAEEYWEGFNACARQYC